MQLEGFPNDENTVDEETRKHLTSVIKGHADQYYQIDNAICVDKRQMLAPKIVRCGTRRRAAT